MYRFSASTIAIAVGSKVTRQRARPATPGGHARTVVSLLCWIAVLAFTLASLTPALAQGRGSKKETVFFMQSGSDGTVVRMQVTIDTVKNVSCDTEFGELVVANPAIADVVVVSNKSIQVLGKKAGTTNISVVGRDKRILGLVNVEVAHDVDSLTQRLQKFVPNSKIVATAVNGKVLLTGSVPDAPSMSRAMAIAEQVAPGAVTNAMTVRGSQQVMLEVRFVEAKRESSRDLGVGWDVFGKGASQGFNFLETSGALVSGNTPFGVAIARLLDKGTKADVIIKALEKRGLARRLAEPNLVALSGDTASFLAGGEFPFPVQAENNKITVEFKKFGIGLAFTPTVLGEGQINLKIEPEVSELDPTSKLRVGEFEVPSLSVRRAATTIELRDGQSFAIAGLLHSNNFKNQSQLPGIGEVPVLGMLFRSAAFQRNETDLVIIVTPRLVRPARPDQPLHDPHEGRVPSNDPEFFLGGKQEIRVQPQRGHILDLRSQGQGKQEFKVARPQPLGGHILDPRDQGRSLN
jgi:pilus assembly protein CpaC